MPRRRHVLTIPMPQDLPTLGETALILGQRYPGAVAKVADGVIEIHAYPAGSEPPPDDDDEIEVRQLGSGVETRVTLSASGDQEALREAIEHGFERGIVPDPYPPTTRSETEEGAVDA